MQSRPLLLTADSRFWKTDTPAVLLGEWCLAGLREAPLPAYTVLPSPWDRHRDIDATGRYLDEFMEGGIRHLADGLNVAHGTDFDLRGWRILVGNWLLHAVHTLYDRYYLLKSAFSADPGLELCVPTVGKTDVWQTTSSFKNAQLYPDTSLILFARIATALGFPVWASPAIAPNPENSLFCPSRGVGLARRLAKLAKAAIRGSNSQTDTMFFATGASSSVLRAFDGRVASQDPDDWTPSPVVDVATERRKELFAAIPRGDEFQDMCSAVLPQLLPRSALEDFSLWRARANRLKSRRRFRSVVTAYGFGGNDLASHQLLDFRLQGSKLYGAQHGGGYGSFAYCPEELHETRCADLFLTWGWTTEEKQRPLPALPLVAPGRSHSRRQGDNPPTKIMLLGTDRPHLTHRIMSHPLSGQISRYFDFQKRFFEALDEETKKDFVLKPYVDDFSSAGSGWWKEKGVAVENRSLSAVVGDVKLAVVDHNATGYLELLARDIPTVVFWDPQLWELRQSVLPVFDALRSAGIFHTTPEAASAHANRVARKPLSWWDEPGTQAARIAFCRQLARASEDWQQQWQWLLSETGAPEQIRVAPKENK